MRSVEAKPFLSLREGWKFFSTMELLRIELKEDIFVKFSSSSLGLPLANQWRKRYWFYVHDNSATCGNCQT